MSLSPTSSASSLSGSSGASESRLDFELHTNRPLTRPRTLPVSYKTVVTLRHAYFRSKEYCNSLHARSIMITGIQRQYQSDEGVLSLLTSLNVPYPTTSVHIGRKVGQLAELVEAHNDAVRELEKVLTTYTKNGQLGSKRPTMQIGGFMGIGGQKVDTIDYMTAKIKRFEDKVEQTRDTISDKKSEPYGFASFQAVPYAHVVAKRLQDKKVKGCKFSLAPLPSGELACDSLAFHGSSLMGPLAQTSSGRICQATTRRRAWAGVCWRSS